MSISHIVIGLGNPGTEYLRSPHNAGFEAAAELRALLKAPRFAASSDALVSNKIIRGEEVILALPQTFMNRSGIAVKRLMDKHDVPAARLIVCYDDLDLPFGSFRLRPHGGAGGHHGIESIIEEIGTSLFPRVRIGVKDESVKKDEVVDYLLAPLGEERYNELLGAAKNAALSVRDALYLGWQKAMSLHNKKEAKAADEKKGEDDV
jgi:peptidyl-tRNA hydrolase, PTH1 family